MLQRLGGLGWLGREVRETTAVLVKTGTNGGRHNWPGTTAESQDQLKTQQSLSQSSHEDSLSLSAVGSTEPRAELVTIAFSFWRVIWTYLYYAHLSLDWSGNWMCSACKLQYDSWEKQGCDIALEFKRVTLDGNSFHPFIKHILTWFLPSASYSLGCEGYNGK